MKRGWCPTLEAPMQAADGWLVRVRPALGRLSSGQARALCGAAEQWGNGQIELTSHANLQVRGLRDVAAFARAMERTGLRSPMGRVIVSPLAGDDPGVAPGTLDRAADVEARLARDGVPHPKHTVVVDGGGVLPLATAGARTIPCGDVGYHGGRAFGFGIPFGALSTSQLLALSKVADEHADGTLRLTPWRVLLLGRVRGAPVPPPGITTDPDDPLMRTAACVGAPGCTRATTATRADATRLARPGLHVSGCAKGCAQPGPVQWTLVGRDGRYDLVRNGAASDTPVLRGLSPADIPW